MRSKLRDICVCALALTLIASVPAWAQGYPTQSSGQTSGISAQAPSVPDPAQSAPSSAPQAQTAPPAAAAPDDSAAPNAKPDKNAPSQATLSAIDSIGNRNVGCGRGAGNWYSLDKQVAMGQQYAQQIEHAAKLITDPVVIEYVNRVGQNLVRNSDSKVPFTIKVIDTDEINAFALPGGFFYVNSGLILAADNEAELAGVMAHEIAHVAARHATKNMTRAQIWNIASVPLIFIGGPVAYAISEVASLAVPLGFLKFSRDAEREADLLGLEYDYAAGYDPEAFVEFFEKLKLDEKKKQNLVAKAFATHPMNADRIKAAQDEIRKYLPDRTEYVVDTSEFEDVKLRLARLENGRRLGGAKGDPTRPVLLKRSSSSGSDSGNTAGQKDDGSTTDQKDDGRPTLKRTPSN